MTASEPTADGEQERTDQITSEIADTIAHRAVPVADELRSRLFLIRDSAYEGDPESLQEIADLLSEKRKEIEAMEELAKAALARDD
ncbi:hypothetical protein [Halapricum hydrolyticum]|uniref:Uncharacterized protein n=1 Tax=Halapricum hydrolyticum TaxID=2979991 RepID=A0AAE3IF99_9EURY|nr:hypothetical protein [Halapricum hydrolyticum]MCU4728649.1 hypothetical protein [Halapricum hydrolyticum]